MLEHSVYSWVLGSTVFQGKAWDVCCREGGLDVLDRAYRHREEGSEIL